jgi:hypothetical protein
MMATLSVLKFNSVDGADQALNLLESLQKQQLIQVIDAAVVSWPADKKKPKTRQLYPTAGAGVLSGAFWGMLFGLPDPADPPRRRANKQPGHGTFTNDRYSDELAGYQGWPDHFTVCHSDHEWARDADGDGWREVHCNTCEGSGAALQTFLRRFRGVHKAYLACYVAIYEAMTSVTRITSALVRRLCFGTWLHTSYR